MYSAAQPLWKPKANTPVANSVAAVVSTGQAWNIPETPSWPIIDWLKKTSQAGTNGSSTDGAASIIDPGSRLSRGVSDVRMAPSPTAQRPAGVQGRCHQ